MKTTLLALILSVFLGLSMMAQQRAFPTATSIPATNSANANAAAAMPPATAGAGGSLFVLLTALFGAIIGAFTAYLCDWLKEGRKKRKDQHGAIMRTQLALISQFNTIDNLEKQFLEPFRQEPERELKLISFVMHDTNLRVNYDAIAFLLETKNPTLVLEVHAAEQSYLAAMDALNLRNEAYERLHSNSSVESLNRQTGQATIVVKDPRNLKLLKDTTDSLYTSVARAKERLTKHVNELYNVGKLLYPKRTFLQFEEKREEHIGVTS